MGNHVLTRSASPFTFMKTETNKFHFIKKRKRKPICFISSTQNYIKVDDNISSDLYTSEFENIRELIISNKHKKDPQLITKVESKDVSMVLTMSTTLHRLDYRFQYLPLGTILHALFQCENWLYVRTAHGEEGYISSDICLPLEASNDITQSADDCLDLEPLKMIYKVDLNDSINYSERNVDMLYLQANCIRQRKRNPSKTDDENEASDRKSVILLIKNDYQNIKKGTLSVKKGDVVLLLHNRVTGWFWVKNEQNREGFIPAAVAGYIES